MQIFTFKINSAIPSLLSLIPIPMCRTFLSSTFVTSYIRLSLNQSSVFQLMKTIAYDNFDNFLSNLLKLNSPTFAKLILHAFCSIVRNKSLADVTKKPLPLYKGGPRDFIQNYRPITLLPDVSISFEWLLFDFIIKYEKRNRITLKKFGFQVGKNTSFS